MSIRGYSNNFISFEALASQMLDGKISKEDKIEIFLNVQDLTNNFTNNLEIFASDKESIAIIKSEGEKIISQLDQKTQSKSNSSSINVMPANEQPGNSFISSIYENAQYYLGYNQEEEINEPKEDDTEILRESQDTQSRNDEEFARFLQNNLNTLNQHDNSFNNLPYEENLSTYNTFPDDLLTEEESFQIAMEESKRDHISNAEDEDKIDSFNIFQTDNCFFDNGSTINKYAFMIRILSIPTNQAEFLPEPEIIGPILSDFGIELTDQLYASLSALREKEDIGKKFEIFKSMIKKGAAGGIQKTMYNPDRQERFQKYVDDYFIRMRAHKSYDFPR